MVSFTSDYHRTFGSSHLTVLIWFLLEESVFRAPNDQFGFFGTYFCEILMKNALSMFQNYATTLHVPVLVKHFPNFLAL